MRIWGENIGDLSIGFSAHAEAGESGLYASVNVRLRLNLSILAFLGAKIRSFVLFWVLEEHKILSVYVISIMAGETRCRLGCRDAGGTARKQARQTLPGASQAVCF
jgi:hypothetical protein